MSDRIQNIQKSRRAFLYGAAAVGGLILADAKIARATAAVADCGPLPTDGRDPLCVTTDNDIFGQVQIGGFYFESTGDRKDKPDNQFTSGIDIPVQGVKDRRILVEQIKFAGSGDYIQLNPNSRKVEGDVVTYQDVKEGRNSGTRQVEAWTVFELPADGGDGLGIDKRTGRDRLVIDIRGGSLVDKVWASVDDGKRFDRHECSGNCQWNCVRFYQFSRLKANAQIGDLSAIIPTEAIHRDARGLLSSFTDYAWLWDTKGASNAHVDYSAINTSLTPELREKERVVPSYVAVPRKLVPYTNFSR